MLNALAKPFNIDLEKTGGENGSVLVLTLNSGNNEIEIESTAGTIF